jgi:hypothetical protein
VLTNELTSINLALMMMEKYPAALSRRNIDGQLPLHVECECRSRSPIIAKFIESYPEALAKADSTGYLPLHMLLWNQSSSIDDAMMMIEIYPAALRHRNTYVNCPLHFECITQCRSAVISKCIERYPEAVDDQAIAEIIIKINKRNFHAYTSILSMVFTVRSMSLYSSYPNVKDDIRLNPPYRRRILNLLPRHVFTPTHESDYRDLNWQPRSAMMILLSQMQIQHPQGSNSAQSLGVMVDDGTIDVALVVHHREINFRIKP